MCISNCIDKVLQQISVTLGHKHCCFLWNEDMTESNLTYLFSRIDRDPNAAIFFFVGVNHHHCLISNEPWHSHLLQRPRKTSNHNH